MGIEFCPVCGKILQIKDVKGKHMGVCSCGFKRASIDVSASDNTPKNTLINVGEGAIKDNGEKAEKLTYEDKKERKADY